MHRRSMLAVDFFTVETNHLRRSFHITPTAYILNVYTNPAHRRQGHAHLVGTSRFSWFEPRLVYGRSRSAVFLVDRQRPVRIVIGAATGRSTRTLAECR